MLPVIVRDNNIEKALRILKRSNQRSGLGKELRKRRAYIKPSEEKQKRNAESKRRLYKNLRKRLLRDGY